MRKGAAGSLPDVRPYSSLRGRDAFSRVYRDGRRIRKGPLLIIIADGPQGPPRVGFVAGRRVGNSVTRNRAKRRLREAFRRVALDEGTAYLAIASPGVVQADFERLVDWCREAVEVGRKQEKT